MRSCTRERATKLILTANLVNHKSSQTFNVVIRNESLYKYTHAESASQTHRQGMRYFESCLVKFLKIVSSWSSHKFLIARINFHQFYRCNGAIWFDWDFLAARKRLIKLAFYSDRKRLKNVHECSALLQQHPWMHHKQIMLSWKSLFLPYCTKLYLM